MHSGIARSDAICCYFILLHAATAADQQVHPRVIAQLGVVVGQTHTKVHISISTNFGRFIANGLINQSLLRKRLTALALCKSGLCYS